MYVCTLTVYRHMHMYKCTNAHTAKVSTLLLQCMVVKKALNIMLSTHLKLKSDMQNKNSVMCSVIRQRAHT